MRRFGLNHVLTSVLLLATPFRDGARSRVGDTPRAEMRWLGALLALGVVPLSGCITIAGDQLDDVVPTPSAIRPQIEHTVGDFSFDLDGGKMVTSNKMGRSLNDVILEMWKESEFISDHEYVKSSEFSDSSVYRLTLSGNHQGESSIALQILSGLTLLVIPYSVVSKMDLHYSLEHSGTGCVFEANASDSYRTITGLLLLPATPFGLGGGIRTYERIANNLYDQLATQGAFEQHPTCKTLDVPAAALDARSRAN